MIHHLSGDLALSWVETFASMQVEDEKRVAQAISVAQRFRNPKGENHRLDVTKASQTMGQTTYQLVQDFFH